MKFKRKYRVVAIYAKGIYAWDSDCQGFGLFERVSSEMIEIWQKYATEKSGFQCAVVSFMRIKP